MTAEEAIEMFERVKHGAIYLVHQRMDNGEVHEDFSLCDAAIDALKKQIPMKPTGEHYAHMRCPSCNHRIPSGQGSSSRRRDNWCNYCGQKIDWGDNHD